MNSVRLTGNGECCVTTASHSSRVASHTPVRARVSVIVVVVTSSSTSTTASLCHSEEEEGAIRKNQSVASRFERLAVAVPTHFRLRLTVHGAPERRRFVAQHLRKRTRTRRFNDLLLTVSSVYMYINTYGHVRRVVDNPWGDLSSTSTPSRSLDS